MNNQALTEDDYRTAKIDLDYMGTKDFWGPRDYEAAGALKKIMRDAPTPPPAPRPLSRFDANDSIIIERLSGGNLVEYWTIKDDDAAEYNRIIQQARQCENSEQWAQIYIVKTSSRPGERRMPGMVITLSCGEAECPERVDRAAANISEALFPRASDLEAAE